MKRQLIAATVLLFVGQAEAQNCNPVDFAIKPISFQNTPFEIAAIRLVAGTPFTVNLDRPTNATVSAKGVEGRLDSVLNALVAQSGGHWAANGCQIVFRGLPAAVGAQSQQTSAPETPAAPAPKKWSFREGEMLKAVLERWAKEDGWTLSWELEANLDYEMPFSQTLEGALEQVLDSLVFGINRNGRQIAARFYDGNRVLRVFPRTGTQSEVEVR